MGLWGCESLLNGRFALTLRWMRCAGFVYSDLRPSGSKCRSALVAKWDNSIIWYANLYFYNHDLKQFSSMTTTATGVSSKMDMDWISGCDSVFKTNLLTRVVRETVDDMPTEFFLFLFSLPELRVTRRELLLRMSRVFLRKCLPQ